ncbi:MAG: hypothetical protein F4Z14_06575 [Gammaproteobacteria bacterium]|nr:hypothetical protein [Gammaproteobacteria bacterium]
MNIGLTVTFMSVTIVLLIIFCAIQMVQLWSMNRTQVRLLNLLSACRCPKRPLPETPAGKVLANFVRRQKAKAGLAEPQPANHRVQHRARGHGSKS